MTVTGKNGKEQLPGRVVRVHGLDQRRVLLDDAGNRITRFDGIIRDVEAAGLNAWTIARLLLAWQRHVWERGCREDHLDLVWADAVERLAPPEAHGALVAAVLMHLRDGQCAASVAEEVDGLLNHRLSQPTLQYVRGHSGGPGTEPRPAFGRGES